MQESNKHTFIRQFVHALSYIAGNVLHISVLGDSRPVHVFKQFVVFNSRGQLPVQIIGGFVEHCSRQTAQIRIVGVQGFETRRGRGQSRTCIFFLLFVNVN